jgi:uncharacterized membrane protein YfcA
MIELPELSILSWVLAGALIAGFTTGFAGFGTGLVASGIWFHVLPAHQVPPLIALTSVAAQIVGLFSVRRSFEWRRASPLLAGGALGVPVGVFALSIASPDMIRGVVGAFLVAYVVFHLLGSGFHIAGGRNWKSDGVVGLTGGLLGGFAGLSGPVPLVWLQLHGGNADVLRATYQPFNLLVLLFASSAMLASGRIDWGVVGIFAACVPVTLIGARLGVSAYRNVSEGVFWRVIMLLLFVSGAVLSLQAIL